MLPPFEDCDTDRPASSCLPMFESTIVAPAALNELDDDSDEVSERGNEVGNEDIAMAVGKVDTEEATGAVVDEDDEMWEWAGADTIGMLPVICCR